MCVRERGRSGWKWLEMFKFKILWKTGQKLHQSVLNWVYPVYSQNWARSVVHRIGSSVLRILRGADSPSFSDSWWSPVPLWPSDPETSDTFSLHFPLFPFTSFSSFHQWHPALKSKDLCPREISSGPLEITLAWSVLDHTLSAFSRPFTRNELIS